MLDRIVRNAAEMDRLVGQLLDLSSLDAGHVRLRAGRVEVLGAVVSCVASLGTAVADRVEVEVPGGIVVAADAHALDRVLSNLVTNGVKFSPPDRPVRVRASVDGPMAVVTVLDEGVGIPPEEHERVFDRFYQLGSTERGPRHGTGIGLPIVRRYVELLGGRVWVDSRPGSGSAFSFTLPLAPG
jgi:signal transduction histidine kinase